ncbi:hypothetical protein V6N13_115455 [Hibiscus sabdariffa]|uniref:BHLH domain-containing protein n=1 Tax=Hibiscus sabdariffa TaxID=183260 RepID=A0ABR2CRS3_9ROSI
MELGSQSTRMNRCLIERERRRHMKLLSFQLSSLLPPQPTKMSMPELVDQATAYVKELQQNLEKYKQMKVEMKEKLGPDGSKKSRKISPVLNITDLGSHLEVNLITGLNNRFALSDFIGILHEGGAEIISATCQYTEDRAIYTIFSQAIYPRIGIATSSVHERLKSLIC